MCDWNKLYRKKSQPESSTKIMSIGFSLSYNLPSIWFRENLTYIATSIWISGCLGLKVALPVVVVQPSCIWILGSIGAVVHGSSMPFFLLLFGQMVNGFGKKQTDLNTMTHEVSKYALYFVYLGLVVCVSSYAEIGYWMYTGERQVSALRKRYLEAVLKQDVGFYDTDARTGDIVFSVSTDTLLVQDAISEKVRNFIHYLSTFLAGLVVGFVSTWKLALLSVAVIPGIAFASGLYAYTLRV